jgi:cell division protein FtsI/penicillin-binding protein 2
MIACRFVAALALFAALTGCRRSDPRQDATGRAEDPDAPSEVVFSNAAPGLAPKPNLGSPPAVSPRPRPTAPALDAFALGYQAEIERSVGRKVALTLEPRLQAIVRAAVEATGKRAAAVVVDVHSGAVLAAYSNDLVGDADLLRTSLIPGCTFKAIFGVVLLETSAIEASSAHECEGEFTARGHTFRGFKAHGPLTLQSALATSCDNFFQAVGLDVELDTLARHARRGFGFGEATGVEVAEADRGTVPTTAWYAERGRRASIKDKLDVMTGHADFRATPFQMVRAFAAIASGELVPLHLVRDSNSKASPLPYRAEHLETVREGLAFSVSRWFGTASRSRIDDLPFAGKTGSVREEGRVLGMFAGYAPVDSPRIALFTMVRGPRASMFGAVPLAREVLVGWRDNR